MSSKSSAVHPFHGAMYDYIVPFCPLCDEIVLYEDGLYFCSSEKVTKSHFLIDVSETPEPTGQIHYIQIHSPSLGAEIDFKANCTIFYALTEAEFYKSIDRLLTYEEILKYFKNWILI